MKPKCPDGSDDELDLESGKCKRSYTPSCTEGLLLCPTGKRGCLEGEKVCGTNEIPYKCLNEDKIDNLESGKCVEFYDAPTCSFTDFITEEAKKTFTARKAKLE